ncbi:MAG TPA: hypothetical protein VNO70_23310 [Blastocatellia bacterium]|nr:hypothetical protein [Blastocatellia bacterium]
MSIILKDAPREQGWRGRAIQFPSAADQDRNAPGLRRYAVL